MAPLGAVTDITARITSDQPLLDFYWHSFDTNTTHDTVFLTYTRPITVAGAATLTLVAAEENAGGVQIAGSPLGITVVPGAVVSASWTVPASAAAGSAINIDATLQVQSPFCPCMCYGARSLPQCLPTLQHARRIVLAGPVSLLRCGCIARCR